MAGLIRITTSVTAAMQLLQAGIPFTDELKRVTSDALGFGRVDMTQINELLAYGGVGLAVAFVSSSAASFGEVANDGEGRMAV